MWESANGPLEITPQTLTAQPAPHVPYDRAPRQDQPVSPAKAAGWRAALIVAAALALALPAAPVFGQESQTPHAVRDSGGAWSGATAMTCRATSPICIRTSPSISSAAARPTMLA
ncbi:MAG: hypothetical protein ACTHLA_03745 [Asticcacaulis sp.]|uniref:hypothetical protein n=1 Tax=Asticcacaulis sp. TaxID=1872648 RepID=UPI003F7C59C5